ncbi:hypothetical protein EC988_003915 [Linderina pennispora]|nr:hypothetical protein EC988_003915 [Linderina pennispora]
MSDPVEARRLVVIVTRVSSWVGTETAVHLLKRGVTVIGIASYQHRMDRVTSMLQLKDLPGKFVPFVGKLNSQDLVNQIAARVEQEGKLIAFVNNAGAFTFESDEPMSNIERWDMLQLSLIAPLRLFHTIRHTLRKARGRVVNVSSDDVHVGLERWLVLAAVKTAVNMATAEIALIDPQLTAIAVHPNIRETLTPDLRTKADTSETPAEVEDVIDSEQLQPAGEMIASLALTADRSMSGQFLVYQEPPELGH